MIETARRTLKTILLGTLLGLLSMAFAQTIPTRIIVNPSFETPNLSTAGVCTAGGGTTQRYLPDASYTGSNEVNKAAGWRTTDSPYNSTGFSCATFSLPYRPVEYFRTPTRGVAAEGSQWVELNAENPRRLYQNICLVSGETVPYTYSQRARFDANIETSRAALYAADGVTLIAAGADFTATSIDTWNTRSGTLTNSGPSGTYQYGFEARVGAGGTAGTIGSGRANEGNFVDNVRISLRPLVDINRFLDSTGNPISSVGESAGTVFLELIVNGTITGTNATVTLTRSGLASTADFSVGSPNRGSASADAAGNITLTIPAGEYDPNASSGSQIGAIRIPITITNDSAQEGSEPLSYAITGSTNPGAAATEALTTNIGGQSAFCGPVVGSTTLNILDEADVLLEKSGPATATQGTAITYTIKVWNRGPNPIGSSSFIDAVPSSVTGTTWSCAASGTASCGSSSSGSGNTINLTTGLLPLNAAATDPTSGSYLTFTISGTLSSAGALSNTATIAAPPGVIDPTPANNSSTVNSVISGPPGSVSGSVYHDLNSNSAINSGEPRLANITVELRSGTTVVATTTTDASGNYSFGSVTPGSYTVRVSTTDTDLPSGSALSTPNDVAVTLAAGASSSGNNFGFRRTVLDVIKSAGSATAINATTFVVPYTVVVGNTGQTTLTNIQVSENLNRTFSSGSPSISIVAASLNVTASSGATCTASSTFDGTTVFGLLSGTNDFAPGQSCTITFQVRLVYSSVAAVPTVAQNNSVYASSIPGASATNAGHTFPGGTPTGPAGAVATDTSTNATNPATPASLPSPANAGGDTPGSTPVFLVSTVGAVSGTLYNDQNNNSSFNDGNDPRLPAGIDVQLVDGGGAVVSTIQTDAQGNYSFPAVAAGSYTVRVVTSDPQIPAGLLPTAPATASAPVTVTTGATSSQNFGFQAVPPANNPFVCGTGTTFYQVRSSSTEAALLRFSSLGGSATSVWTSNVTVGLNGLAYNTTDNFLYAFNSAGGTAGRDLYRLGDQTAVRIGQVVAPALTDTFLITGATFDQAGRYYFAGQGSGNIAPSAIYRIDSFADSDPGTAGVQIAVAATYTLSATTPNVGDIAFGPDGNLYGATGTSVYQFALSGTSATVASRTVPDVGGIGSAYFDNNFNFYVYNNGSQTLYSVTFGFGTSFATAAATSASAGSIPYSGSPALPASIGATDGASCVSAATTGTVTGTLYRDNNTNGTFESASDTRFPAAISVELVNDQGTPSTADDVVVQTVQTNASGVYSFTNVPVGSNYTVRVVSTDTDIPVGSTSTAPVGAIYDDVAVTPGATVTRNFGYQNIALDAIKSAGAPVQVSATVFEVPFTVVVGNTGAQPTSNVQVSENLSRTFSAGSPVIALVGVPALTVTASTGATCTANPAFNGTSVFGLLAGTDDLTSGQSCTIGFRVRLTYPSAAAIPSSAQNNSVYASSIPGAAATNPGHTFPGGVPTPPTGAIVTDTSTGATNPATPAGLPGTPRGDTPNPTAVTFVPNPGSIAGTLYLDQNNNTSFNDGSDPRLGAGVSVELVSGATVLATTTTDSDGNYRFLNVDPGSYTVRVVTSDPDLRGVTPSAPASGSLTVAVSPGAATTSQNFGFSRTALDIIKSASAARQIDIRTYEVTYTVVAANTGTTALSNVQLSENLSLTFAQNNPSITISSAPRKTAGAATCSINSAFDGTTNFSLLSGSDTWQPGQNCTVSFSARVQYADAASVPTTVQNNSVYGSSTPTGPNPGHTFPGGTPTAPPGAVATDTSTTTSNPASPSGLPSTPNVDTPGGTPVSFTPNLGSISGTLYNDLNGNRSFDGTPQDRRLAAGITVELVDGSGNVAQTTTTDGSGNYSFNAVPQGTYSVRVPSNTTNTALGTLQPVAPTSSQISGIVIGAGTISNNRNFGFNNPPVADNDSATTPFNTPVTFSASTGDVDPDGFVDTSTVDLDPSTPGDQKTRTTPDGTFSVDNSGNVTFTPAPTFSGTATIPYTVRDNTGNTSNPANLPVTVRPPQPPVAVADTGATLPDTNVTIDPKTNDSTPNRGATLVPGSIVFPATGQPAGAVIGGDGKSISIPGQGLYTTGSNGDITFDPDPAFLGTATPIFYTIQDSTGQTSNPASVTIRVRSPAAVDDSATTPFATPVTLNPLTNDRVAAGATLVPASVVFPVAEQPAGAVRSADGKSLTVPGEGTYTIDTVTGVVSFNPAPGFTGNTSPVKYTVEDSTGSASLPANIRITVGPPAIPVANPDSATTPFGTPVTLTPATNDTAGTGSGIVPNSIDLDPSTPGQETVRNVPGQGLFEVLPSGQVRFTPEPGFAGTVQVPYTIKDNLGQTSAPSTLTVNVTPPPAPVARDDSKAGDFNQTVVVPATLNDSSSPNTTLVPGSIDLDPSTPGRETTRTVPGKGTFTANPDGTVTFVPVSGFEGTAVIPYTVKDNLGQTSNPANIAVTIRPRPAPPVANNDSATTPRATPVTLDAIANDNATLPNTLEPNSIDLDPNTPGRQTSFTVPGRGTFVAQPDGKVIFTPVAGFVGNVTIPYTIQDRDSDPSTSPQTSNIANLTVTVTELPAARDDRINTPVNTPVNVPVLTNDLADTGAGRTINPATVDLDPSTPGQQTSKDVPGQGIFEVQPDGQVRFTPVPGFVGVATTPYTVQDSAGTVTNPANIIVTVTPTPPSASDDRTSTPFRTPVTLNPTTNDTAGAGGQLRPGTIDLDPNTPGQQTELVVPGQGRFVLQPATNLTNESVQFIPQGDFSGTVSIPYTVQDNFGQTSNPANLIVTVNPPTAPIASNDIDSTKRNTPITVNPVNNDSAGAGTSLVPGSIDLDPSTPGQQTRYEVPGQGVFVLNPDGTVTFTPATDFVGTVQAPYTINDATGQPSNVARIVITVNPLPAAAPDSANTPFNTAVTLNPLTNDTPSEGATFNPATLDLDPLTPGIQDSLTVPGKGTFVRNPDGTVTFTPVDGFTGTVTIPYTVQDSANGTTNTATIAVTVIPPKAPVAADDNARTPYNTPVTLNPILNDQAGPGGTLVPGSIDLDPATPGQQTRLEVPGKGVLVLNPDGTVTFTPQEGFVGEVKVPYTIRDTAGQESNPATITITVDGPRLTLTKQAVQSVARVGGSLEYILKATNEGAGEPMRRLTIVDVLPLGLEYRTGTSRLNGAAIADPQITTSNGRQRLVWVLGSLASGQSAELRFTTVVTAAVPTNQPIINVGEASALIGNALNPTTVSTASNQAIVRIELGVFSDKGTIVGRVYFDKNNDNNFTAGTDEPLQGVRVYLSDGRYAVTDNFGRYSIPEVAPGLNALRVDTLTVPYTPKAVPDDRGLRGTRQVRVEGAGIYTEDFLFEAPQGEARVTRSTRVTVDGQRLEKTITQVSGNVYTVTLTLTTTRTLNNLRLIDPVPTEGTRSAVSGSNLQPVVSGNEIRLGTVQAGTYTLSYTLTFPPTRARPIERLITDPDMQFEGVR